MSEFAPGDYCTHPQFCGVVLRYVGPETDKVLPEPPEHTCEDANAYDADDPYGYGCAICIAWGSDEEDWETVETGRVYVRMVGDDQHHAVDQEDLTRLEDQEDEICSCGQIGCRW
jgi:hypothetical protein